MRLSLATVQQLKEAASKSSSTAAAAATAAAGGVVEWPNYNPKDLTPGILHVG